MKSINIKRATLTTILIASLLFCITSSVWAQSDPYGLKKTAEKAYGPGVKQADLPTAIGQIIGVVLSFLGIIFLILTIYGGFMWMTAHGNEEQITKARKVIIGAAIGLAIILLAYTITSFITSELSSAVIGT